MEMMWNLRNKKAVEEKEKEINFPYKIFIQNFHIIYIDISMIWFFLYNVHVDSGYLEILIVVTGKNSKSWKP